MLKLTNVMLEMIFSDSRGIMPYGHAQCHDSVNAWCERISQRDPSVNLEKSEWIVDGKRINADSLLTDAIWCQLWFASKAKQDAQLAQPKRAFELLKQACKMYDQILIKFVPQKIVNDHVYRFATPLTCALQYLECLEKMLHIVENERSHADLGAKSALNGTRACIQMICCKFSHVFTASDALQTSAHALYYKGASLKQNGKQLLFSWKPANGIRMQQPYLRPCVSGSFDVQNGIKRRRLYGSPTGGVIVPNSFSKTMILHYILSPYQILHP